MQSDTTYHYEIGALVTIYSEDRRVTKYVTDLENLPERVCSFVCACNSLDISPLHFDDVVSDFFI